MVGCRCPQPSTRRILCDLRAVKVAPRGAEHAGLGPTGGLCGRCELVAGRLDGCVPALVLVGGQPGTGQPTLLPRQPYQAVALRQRRLAPPRSACDGGAPAPLSGRGVAWH
eukprot:scaffold45126_cov55-Phaeocystis_antarctica.AAC.1